MLIHCFSEVSAEGEDTSAEGDTNDRPKEEVVTVATSLPNQATPPDSGEEGDTAVRQRWV